MWWAQVAASSFGITKHMEKLPNMTAHHPGDEAEPVRQLLEVSWDCLSGCTYRGTVPLAEKPEGSEFPWLLEDSRVTGSSWEQPLLP